MYVLLSHPVAGRKVAFYKHIMNGVEETTESSERQRHVEVVLRVMSSDGSWLLD